MYRGCGNDICIRPFESSDRDALVRLGNNKNVSKWLANLFPHPYRVEDADAWIALTAAESPSYNLAVTYGGELAGGVGLKPMADVHSGTAEIGYWLGEPYWGKGIMTHVVGAMTDYGLHDLLFIRLQAEVFPGNAGSMRVLEKNGYEREAILRKHIRKDGVIMDSHLYARLRNP